MKKNRQFLFGILEAYVGYLLIKENALFFENGFHWQLFLGFLIGVYAVRKGISTVNKTL
jgi:hypothetical protein